MKIVSISNLVRLFVFKSSWRLRQIVLRRDKNLKNQSRLFYETSPIALSGKYAKQIGDYRDYAVQFVNSRAAMGSLLEIGCGDGNILWRLRIANKTGMDFSKALLRRAKTKNPDSSFILADAEHLPFRVGSFDFTVCFDVLEHVGNPSEVLTEATNSAKKCVFLTTDYDGILHPSPRRQLIDNTPPLRLLSKHKCQMCFLRQNKPTNVPMGLLFGAGVLCTIRKE